MMPDATLWTWWGPANHRRAELIIKKIEKGLSEEELAEYTVLQGIATIIMSAVTPPFDLSPLKEIARRAEKLAAKIQHELHKRGEAKGSPKPAKTSRRLRGPSKDGHTWSNWHQNQGAPAFRFKMCYACNVQVEKEWGSTYQKPDPVPACERIKK